MDLFFPDQRWSSEGEPELGVGIVVGVSKGRVEIKFPIAEEMRIYAAENAPLRRVRFKPGDTIVDVHGHKLLIIKVEESENLINYLIDGRKLSEAELGNVSVKQGAEDRLLLGQVDTPQNFALRQRTLQNDYHMRISPVNGFVGGRIDLIPHQLYIADEVSTRYAPRVLLSDEVGLGKTIEACLILHRLLLSGRISRVLILVPESLVHQWFVEILRRFNMWFHIFDEERCAALEESAPDGNPFLDDQLVICSTAFLAGSQKRAEQALASGWEMLVVDEAHHLEWSAEEVGRDYAVVEALSKVAEGLLLLTATPEQLGLESHFARLRLLDPERYADYDAFKNESIDHKETADLVEKLSQNVALNSSDKKILESLVGKNRFEKFMDGKDLERNKLIEDLLDQHGPGRVIFRNTRSAMKGFPKRIAHLVPLEDSGNEDKSQIDLDPCVKWLAPFLENIQPAKVLLICKTKEKVLSLEKIFRENGNLKVSVFHEDLTLVQRDRNAAWFSESEGAQLLLCSEIGSEGRNFQFAHHLILFDLPIHPELLEQRIGRLDRIGQTENIQIHIPYIVGSSEEVLVRWYHEGLNAFQKNLEGGNKIAQLFGDRVHKLSLSIQSSDVERELASLVSDTKIYHAELKTTLANGRDRLLEMNSFRPAIAEKLIEQISSEDRSPTLENYMTSIFEHFNIDVEDLAPRTYLLHASPENADIFPAIAEEGSTVTFDRKRALSREEVIFLSWDHPMVKGAIDSVLISETGTASFGILRAAGSPAILLELLFVLETVGGQKINVDRFLPNKLLRVVVDHSGKDVTDLYPVQAFNEKLIPGQIEDLISNETLVEAIIPAMLTAATIIAEAKADMESSSGIRRMNLAMDHEISRLKSLQENNKSIRPEEIQIAVDEKAKLSSLMQSARIRLDALQLIQKGSI